MAKNASSTRQSVPLPQKSFTLCATVVLVADDFQEDFFGPVAVEFAVEDLFPWAEVELAVGDGDDDLAAHDLPLHVGVGVVFASVVVLVLAGGRVRREFLEPFFVVFVQAAF